MIPLPKFLTIDQVQALHKLQIDQFGGSHILNAAQSLATKEQIADFFRRNTAP